MPVLLGSISVRDSVLAVHIAAVVVGFGVIFAQPLIHAVLRGDARALPALHRAQLELTRRLTAPSLLVVVLAGVYLASDTHQWKAFYVQWGVGAALLLGAWSGAFVVPQERRLSELAARDLDTAAGGEGTLGTEYEQLSRRVRRVALAQSLLVLITVYLMANHVGGSG